MLAEVERIVQEVHDRPHRMMMVLAGAGSQALAWLLGVPGASRTLVEAVIPYDWAAFSDFLSREPVQYVSQETARLMAGRALVRARSLTKGQGPLIGLSCTATIVTDREKRGEHRAHVATWQHERIISYYLRLARGARDRRGEEQTVSRLILNAAAHACDLPHGLDLQLQAGDALTQEQTDLTIPVRRLIQREISCFGLSEGGQVFTPAGHPQIILSGAFNPLHEGHLELARAAGAYLGQRVAIELAARNAGKPALAPDIILQRLAQFAGHWPVYVSVAPTFDMKALLYPGATFVIGYDTAVRVLQPRYYGNDRQAMFAALERVREQGCRFLVAGRLDAGDQFRTVTDMEIPKTLVDLFLPLPGFRKDISSTDLRATSQLRRPSGTVEHT